MKLFKLGVSNWHFELDDYEFDAKNVISEKITNWANGKYRIVLKNATFDVEDWNSILKISRINRIIQNFNLRNQLGEKQPDMELEYMNGYMIKHVQKSITDGVSTVTITIVG